MSNSSPEINQRVRIGISSCLLGERVRYDGGHKRDAFLTDILGRHVQWVPVCPEFEMGLGVPREALRLFDEGDGPRVIGRVSGSDHTEAMMRWGMSRVEKLATEQLCGYIFKRSSPSCGLERVKVYNGRGFRSDGAGLFATAVRRCLPNLPVEEEGRLNDPRLRENFIASVFAYKRWLTLREHGVTRAALMNFHRQHKFLLMAHSQTGTRSLGRITTAGGDYFDEFSNVMRRTPSRRNHTNVLQHTAGYFSRQLGRNDRAELTDVIERYRKALLPLIVPVTLIRHYVRKFEMAYLAEQIYLQPHPPELMLLNEL